MTTTWNERPPEVAEERQRFDPARIVAYLRANARGFDSRVKLPQIAAEVFNTLGVAHGSAIDVALRDILKDIVVTTGEPIGSKGGRDGGFWYMVTEADRAPSLVPLRSLEDSVTRRRIAVENVVIG